MSKRRAKGFTLMEVLIALVIIALAFTAIFMAISTYAKNLLYLQNKTAASWVGMNVIAEAQLRLNPQGAPKSQMMFNRMWYYNSIVKATPNPAVSQIDVEVKSAPNAAPLIHLIGYIRNDV